jgi:hypothetical protein
MKNINFNLMKGRGDNVYLKSPFPGDMRFSKPSINPIAFDLPTIISEVESKNKRTLTITKMDK